MADEVKDVMMESTELKLWRQRHMSATTVHFSMTPARREGEERESISLETRRLVYNTKFLTRRHK